MDWQRLINLGVMTPETLTRARSDAATKALFDIGAAYSKAGAPSRMPGTPVNLSSVFTNYQNSLSNSMKQNLMLKQLERQEEEYKRAEANRQKLANMFASDKRMVPTGREKERFISDLSYEHPQGIYGNLPTAGPGSAYWKLPGYQNFDPRQVKPIMEPEMEMRETNENLLALPPAQRRLVAGMGPAGGGSQIGTALLTSALKDTRPSSIKEIDYLQRRIAPLPAGSPERQVLEQRLKKITSPTAPTQITLNNNQNEDMSGRIVKRWFELGGNTDTAQGVVGNMNRLDQLLDQGVKTGFAADKMLSVNRALKAAGLTDKDVSGEEQFITIITKAAISGAKELGVNPTDKDLEMIFQRGPELHKTVKGNRMIIRAYRENAKRTIARNNWHNEFIADNKDLLKTDPFEYEVKYQKAKRQFDEQLYQKNKIDITGGSGSVKTPDLWKSGTPNVQSGVPASSPSVQGALSKADQRIRDEYAEPLAKTLARRRRKGWADLDVTAGEQTIIKNKLYRFNGGSPTDAKNYTRIPWDQMTPIKYPK